MKNMIEFYYNIKLDKVKNKDNIYSFIFNDQTFILKPYYKDESIINSCYRLGTMLNNTLPLNNIILNKYNKPVSIIDNIPYVLLHKKNTNPISLKIISHISNTKVPNITYIKELERNNWEKLWGDKIDYYELQVNENKKKFPLIRESFDYFIGMGENAISYLVNTKTEVSPTIYDNKVPSHNTIYNSLYDPTNIILDHKARDLAEYIKYSFWNTNTNIFNELNEYFKYNYYSEYGIRVLFSRILYPSFYFDLYDQIIIGIKEENNLNNIINRINDYELYLYDIYIYLNKFYRLPEINWIKKEGLNPHLQL